jgi:hypothetical protein
MEPFLITAGLLTTVYTIISLLRYLRGRDWNGALTVASVWGAGVLVVWITAQTDWGSSDVLAKLTNGIPWSALNGWSVVLLGLHVGSAAVAANELRGALDRTTTTAKPKLLNGQTVMVLDNNRSLTVDPPPPAGSQP